MIGYDRFFFVRWLNPAKQHHPGHGAERAVGT